MATRKQYDDAAARVRAGHGSSADKALVERGSHQAGAWSGSMRDAQKKGAKQEQSRSSSWF